MWKEETVITPKKILQQILNICFAITHEYAMQVLFKLFIDKNFDYV
jgi:hypothetical protein